MKSALKGHFVYLFLQKEHDDHMYSLNKMNELLKKMLINEKSSENDNQPCEIDVAFWKSEFECPICFEVVQSWQKVHYISYKA